MSKKLPRKIDPLQRRIPTNPKYEHVKATIDTGASLSKQLQKIEELKQNYKYSKDEIFKRMKITTFVQLLIQVYHLEHDDLELPESPTPGDGSWRGEPSYLKELDPRDSTEKQGGGTEGKAEMDRSTLLGVMQGIGEMDVKDKQHPSSNNNSNNGSTKSQLIIADGTSYSNGQDLCPYLLLDVRDRDAYDRCRIIPALNYPKAMLSRSVNYESKEMLAFKNKEGKIIVTYDDDENVASIVATSLVQRGYDNIFMLSGGLRVAYKMFPQGLITGTIPPSLLSSRDGELVGRPKSRGTEQQPKVEPTKHSLGREDVEKLEVHLSNLMRTSVSRGGSSIMGRSSKSTISLRNGRATSSCASSRNGSISLTSNRPAFRP